MSSDLQHELFTPDPVTGFGSRAALISRLRLAVGPVGGPSVLAIFGLDGLDDFETAHGVERTDDVIAALARELARIVCPEGDCYTTRRRELCVHFDHPLDEVQSVLSAAAISLRREGAISSIGVDLGVAELPGQATGPIAALVIADRSLTTARKARRARSAVPLGR